MTLADIAFKNGLRNIKSYGLYIGSTIFSIIIYFTFITLKYNEDISALSETSKQISAIMGASAFILLIFAAVFIAYSNSFFMKRRKKEIALFSLMGMRKRSIGLILFLENLAIGVISLIVGIGLGFLFSQVLLILLMKLMGLEMVFSFAFSMSAVVETSLVFFLLFLATSVQGYFIIYRFSLIDLFHAEKKGEELPKARVFSAIIGVITLGAAYWLALQDLMTSDAWRILGLAMPLVIIGLIVLGSYFLFRSVLVYALHVVKKRRSFAWNGLHLWTLSQLLYRVKGNARSLTIIAILSATTITAGGAVFGLYYTADKEVQISAPFTFMWEGEDQQIDPSLTTYDETIHSKQVRIEENNGIVRQYALINYTMYAALADQLGQETVETPDANSAILIDTFFDERWAEKPSSVQLENEHYQVSSMLTTPVFNVGTLGGAAIILPDEQYKEIDVEEQVFQAVQVEGEVQQMAVSEALATSTENFSSAIQEYKDAIEASGVLLFVGSFLGLVFLVATGSIIYFKTMAEAESDKEAYRVLHKVGVSRKDMTRSIRHQIGVIFMAPFALGVLHGIVALVAFSALFKMNLWFPVLLWVLAYGFIYSIYYVATVKKFKKSVFN
ncbi:ABC transporter permease [Aureibacillus halotolerans]|uniref:Putative ABC transport system permease protein n=1 Tax=Aureibacillus halotolerans TaxID=1508390 RepID=A0A4V3D5K0_9BACI|nr:ABC transporter permease [Aureibacillus halotolerans]TDQ40367.1 putative ABC transport system permease protein [Aureibacillus halotolerans]